MSETHSTVQALVVAIQAVWSGGRCKQAIAAARRAFECEQRLGGGSAVWRACRSPSTSATRTWPPGGSTTRTHFRNRQDYDQAIEHTGPFPVEKALWACCLGQIARARGQVRTALRWQREAASAADTQIPLPFMPQILGGLRPCRRLGW